MSLGFKGIKIGSLLMGKQTVEWIVHRVAGATVTPGTRLFWVLCQEKTSLFS